MHKLLVFAFALLALLPVLAGCEEEPANVKVVNHWDRVVVFSIDGFEVARLQPLTGEAIDIDEGTHTVTLRLEDGTLLFEQRIHIESLQFVEYHVQSDGTVLASAGQATRARAASTGSPGPSGGS